MKLEIAAGKSDADSRHGWVMVSGPEGWPEAAEPAPVLAWLACELAGPLMRAAADHGCVPYFDSEPLPMWHHHLPPGIRKIDKPEMFGPDSRRGGCGMTVDVLALVAEYWEVQQVSLIVPNDQVSKWAKTIKWLLEPLIKPAATAARSRSRLAR